MDVEGDGTSRVAYQSSSPTAQGGGGRPMEKECRSEKCRDAMAMGRIGVDGATQSHGFNVTALIQVSMGLFPSAFCVSLFDILRFVFLVEFAFA